MLVRNPETWTYNMQSQLAAETLALVKGRPPSLTLPVIAEETGLSVDWLRNFLYERVNIHECSVARVEKLHVYMGEKLKNHG